jgi:hypothetical protein
MSCMSHWHARTQAQEKQSGYDIYRAKGERKQSLRVIRVIGVDNVECGSTVISSQMPASWNLLDSRLCGADDNIGIREFL